MTTPRTAATAPVPVAPPRHVWRLRDMRISAKLAAILTVPLLAIIALTGLVASISGRDAASADRVRSLALLGSDAGEVGYLLAGERAAAASVLMTKDGTAPLFARYRDTIAATDAALGRYRSQRSRVGEPVAEVATVLRSVDDQISGLDGLRDQVLAGPSAAFSATVLRYRILIADLLDFRRSIAQAGAPSAIAEQIRSAAALSQAVEWVGQLQVAGLRAITQVKLTPAGLTQVVSTQAGYADATETFDSAAVPAWRVQLAQTITGEDVLKAERLEGLLSRTSVGQDVPLINAAEWVAGEASRMERLRDVESKVDKDVVTAVTAERGRQLRTTFLVTAIALAVLLLAIILGFGVARSMARSLTNLRRGALDVAYHRLPDVVAQLRDEAGLGGVTADQIADRQAGAIAVTGGDEIGQVAAAFNAVHREAVRVAGEQALMRVGVGAMFVTLARRLQGLVDMLIGRLDRVERDEQDPTRLAELFALDHLATRMRRYHVSLLVLGGTSQATIREEPAPMLDVLRAAQSQVERYTRIEFGAVDEGVSVAPHAVDHVVHALAELLDNATRFSPPQTQVRVEAHRISDRVLVQVGDRGVGMPAEVLQAANLRLATAPRVDASALRAMGLSVVAMIASWLGMKAQLRHNAGGGLVAELTLPSHILEVTAQRRNLPAQQRMGREDQPTSWPPIVPRLLERTGEELAAATAAVALHHQNGDGWVGYNDNRQRSAGWVARPQRPTPPVPVSPALPPVVATPVPALPDPLDDPWRTPADEGWQAAHRATAHLGGGGITANGLPVRVPMARLVPGSVPEVPAGTRRRRDRQAVAAALSAYQRGTRIGRSQRQQPPTAANRSEEYR